MYSTPNFHIPSLPKNPVLLRQSYRVLVLLLCWHHWQPIFSQSCSYRPVLSTPDWPPFGAALRKPSPQLTNTAGRSAGPGTASETAERSGVHNTPGEGVRAPRRPQRESETRRTLTERIGLMWHLPARREAHKAPEESRTARGGRMLTWRSVRSFGAVLVPIPELDTEHQARQ